MDRTCPGIFSIRPLRSRALIVNRTEADTQGRLCGRDSRSRWFAIIIMSAEPIRRRPTARSCPAHVNPRNARWRHCSSRMPPLKELIDTSRPRFGERFRFLVGTTGGAVRDQRTNSSAHDGRRPFTGFSHRRQRIKLRSTTTSIQVSELATTWPSSELRGCNKAEGRATITRTSPVPASTPEWRKRRPQAPLMNLNRASSKTPDTQAWAGNLRRKGSSRYRRRVQSRNLLLSTAARDPQTPGCPPHMVRCQESMFL